MSLCTICTSCQMGEHERHHHVVQAVPEGMIGGSTCVCEGECVDHRYAPKDIKRISDLLVRAAQSELTDLTDETYKGVKGNSEVLNVEISIWQPAGHDEWRASVTDEHGDEYAQVSVSRSSRPDVLLDKLRPYIASMAADFDYRGG